MQGISDIRIVSFDPKRPPVIRKQPYIDLYFELSHEVPKAWGDEFNNVMSKHKFPAKVPGGEGLYIETWVRKPDEIVALVDVLKVKVKECNDSYIARIRLSEGRKDDANRSLSGVGGEQGRLNAIVAGVSFEE